MQTFAVAMPKMPCSPARYLPQDRDNNVISAWRPNIVNPVLKVGHGLGFDVRAS